MGIPKKFSVAFGTVVLFLNYSLFRELQGGMHFSKIQAHTNYTIGWSENSDKLLWKVVPLINSLINT